MASSPDPFIDPDPPFEGTSSPPLPPTIQPPDHTIDTEMEVEPSSSLPSPSNIPTGPARPRPTFTFDLSSDPLGEGHLSFQDHTASGRRQAAFPNRKRGPPARDQGQEPRTKEPRNQDPRNQDPRTQDYPHQEPPSSLARAKILEARDLLLQACTLTKSHDEQSRLLDLLEVFREYTEKGKLYKSSNIIASQVASLESAARKIESKAKALASTPSQNPSLKNPSFAAVASTGASKTTGPQDWTLVTTKTKTPKTDFPVTKTKRPTRLILVKSPTGQATTFSPLAIRNAFNKAFTDKGVKGPVIATVSKSLGQNLVITTTSSFSADYLLEKQSIWEHLVTFQSAQKDEPWYKVVLHGIPISDFNTPTGMALVTEEIKTFNKGLNSIGTPYWLTSADIHKTFSRFLNFQL